MIEVAHVCDAVGDEEQAGRGGGEELAQHVRARTHALSVSIRHQSIPIFAEELPSKIAPERAHHSTIRLCMSLSRRECRANQDGSLRQRWPGDAHRLEYRLNAG